jgi:hypothetical protein
MEVLAHQFYHSLSVKSQVQLPFKGRGSQTGKKAGMWVLLTASLKICLLVEAI